MENLTFFGNRSRVQRSDELLTSEPVNRHKIILSRSMAQNLQMIIWIKRDAKRFKFGGVKEMLRKVTLLAGSLIFFNVWLVVCWTSPGDAYEQWKGRATAKINVRKIPAGNGAIITQIEKGQEVIIRDKREEWYKIVVEEKTYGFMGWVYGKYIKKLPVEYLETSAAIKEIRDTLLPEESKTEDIFLAHSTKSTSINKTGKDEKPSDVPHKDTPAQNGTTLFVKQEGMPSQGKVDRVAEQAEDLSRKKEFVDKKEAETSSGKKNSESGLLAYELPPKKAAPETGRLYTPPLKEPPKVTDGAHREPLGKGAVSGKPSNGAPVKEVYGEGTNNSKSKPVSGVLVGVVIKLLAAVLSCFAIIVAFRARQLAIISHDSTMKLQHTIQGSAPPSNL